jgi:glycoprotein endo-alpha-1,2-mannosidase
MDDANSPRGDTHENRRAFLRGLAVATGGLLAGCLGGDDEPSTATPTGMPGDTPTDAQSTPTDTGGTTPTDAPSTPTATSPPPATPTPAPRREVTDHEGPYTAAFYYPWWGPDRHWADGYVNTPTLGEYDCRDEAVVAQHVGWAEEYGIDSLYCSWWGPDSWEDGTVREYLLPHAEAGTIDVAILYETTGRLEVSGGTVDLSVDANRTRLAEDFASLADVFDSSGYATVEGRVPVFLYLTRILEGDVAGAIAEARDAVDHDLFLIGDQVYWGGPGGGQTQQVLEAVDAVTAYNMHTSVPGIDEGFVSDAIDQYEAWEAALADRSVAFVPDVLPGFDDTAVRPEADHPVIERSPERFREFVEGVDPLRDDDLGMAFVTSFNEWHEDTQIEPAEGYDTDYLEALQEGFESN